MLWYLMILLAETEGLDQAAHARSLIYAYAIRIWPEDTFLLGGLTHFSLETPKKDNWQTVETKNAASDQYLNCLHLLQEFL